MVASQKPVPFLNKRSYLMPLQQPRNKNWQNGSNGTVLTRVSKGEGSERHNPQKEPQSLTVGRQADPLDSESPAWMDFSPLVFFPGVFLSDAFLTVISSFLLSLQVHALSNHRVCSPKVKPQVGFSQGQCLLRGWIQWEQIDNPFLVDLCGLGIPDFNEKLFCLEIKILTHSNPERGSNS